MKNLKIHLIIGLLLFSLNLKSNDIDKVLGNIGIRASIGLIFFSLLDAKKNYDKWKEICKELKHTNIYNVDPETNSYRVIGPDTHSYQNLLKDCSYKFASLTIPGILLGLISYRLMK